MSDSFISLKCPYCGSNMQKDENRNLLVCPACGSEHLLKENVGSLTPPQRKEVHACPRCKRNDQVMKITAILGGQIQQTTGTTEVSAMETDYRGRIYSSTQTVPIHAIQVSRLSQQLRLPDPPVNPYSSEKYPIQNLIAYWLISFIITIVLGFVVFILYFQDGSISGLILVTLLIFSVFIALWIRRNNRNKASRKNFEVYENHLKNEVYPRWGRAQKRWNNAYYCSRDDLVFIDGEKSSVDPEHFSAWLIKTTP